MNCESHTPWLLPRSSRRRVTTSEFLNTLGYGKPACHGIGDSEAHEAVSLGLGTVQPFLKTLPTTFKTLRDLIKMTT